MRHPGPIPDSRPVARVHEPPHLLENLDGAVRIAEACVALDSPDGRAHAFLLGRPEAGRPNQEAREQQQRLARVTGLKGLEDGKRLVHGERDAGIVLRRLPGGWWGVGAVAVSGCWVGGWLLQSRAAGGRAGGDIHARVRSGVSGILAGAGANESG